MACILRRILSPAEWRAMRDGCAMMVTPKAAIVDWTRGGYVLFGAIALGGRPGDPEA
jgi:hypothetical protein